MTNEPPKNPLTTTDEHFGISPSGLSRSPLARACWPAHAASMGVAVVALYKLPLDEAFRASMQGHHYPMLVAAGIVVALALPGQALKDLASAAASVVPFIRKGSDK